MPFIKESFAPLEPSVRRVLSEKNRKRHMGPCREGVTVGQNDRVASHVLFSTRFLREIKKYFTFTKEASNIYWSY